MEQWRVAGSHQCLGEEAVQSQLRSSRRNYNTFGQVSKAMLERGHDRDVLQCRVKVKELRSAYCKAHEGNRCSGAAPTTCRFYKELDVILGGDPTASLMTTMDTSEQGGRGPRVRVLGWGDTPESQKACSQELFSSQEEDSQSQQPVLGEGEAEERVTVSLTTGLPISSTAQRLQNLRKKPRKSKDDTLKAVMDQSAREELSNLSLKSESTCYYGFLRQAVAKGISHYALQVDVEQCGQKKAALPDSNSGVKPLSHHAVDENCTTGLSIELFNGKNKLTTNIVLLSGCPESFMPYSLLTSRRLLTDVVDVLLVV
ncbi:uncharacterized protein ACDP82_012312 [Pangshura tecta]